MPRNTPETLESFLQRQDATSLAAVLLELAAEHEVVRQRLTRMQLADRPDKLAAGFRKTLSAWRRSTKFHGYREAREYGRQLEAWLEQVARELQPKDPAAAVELFEEFIEADATWFDHADDSDGIVGDAVRAACRHWLEAASRCETPADVWPARLMKLALADEYGARSELLRQANLLLDEAALRELVTMYEAQMENALAGAAGDDRLPHQAYAISGALSLLAQALQDPDVGVRGVLAYSPQPNAHQKQEFVRAYLDAGRPADAMRWLEGAWGPMEDSRRSLLAETLGKMGRYAESAPIRQQMFEGTLSVFALQQWLEHLPKDEHPAALERARELALRHERPVTAAELLLHLGDGASAERILVADPAAIDGDNYGALVPLAKALREHECARGETVVYRALLNGILGRGYARAYGHAARYLARLREIASGGASLMPLQPHEDFEAWIRSHHARKAAFWAHVNGLRGMDVDEDDLDR